jgi:hypothetical protein
MNSKQQIVEAVESFVSTQSALRGQELGVTYGRKYAKVFSKHGELRQAEFFIDLETGWQHVAKTWSRPGRLITRAFKVTQ